jgi:hypothetical protein
MHPGEDSGTLSVVGKENGAGAGSPSIAMVNAGIFNHPFGGLMNIGGVLEFFSVHMIHHQYQLLRIATASVHLVNHGSASVAHIDDSQ